MNRPDFRRAPLALSGSGLLGMLALVLLASLLGCRQDDRIVVPNRVLDRPLDVVLGCVRRTDDGRVEAMSLNQCGGDTNPTSTRCDEVEANQLVGFIANSERNEVAMFRQCDINGLVDLDREAPGYNFVPVGQLPTAITATERACRVITANAGSCDLSVIDGRQLAAYAVELEPESAPSSLVSTIVPRTSTGEPLGARPGHVIAAPSRLSLAQSEMEDIPGGGFGDDEIGNFCPNSLSASVYVTFPACQLVAEVSLSTQRILQSRRLLQQPDGSIEIVDSGADPDCYIDCPAQFEGELPQREAFDPNGFQPKTLAFVEPREQMDATLSYDALFVGGGGSDTIVEIPFDDRQWVPPAEANTLLLENPAGVEVIRVTPEGPVPFGGAVHQFLYVVAGDGSTHVVNRHFERESLGVECDTQVDPVAFLTPSPCHEIEPNASGNLANRRPFAIGPGIRSGFGATINDWTFQYVEEPDASRANAPFGEGLVGIGVTSAGTIVYSTFGQFENATPAVNRETINLRVDSHMLWPSPNPFTDSSALPRVVDAEPRRALPAEDQPTQVLAPSLRRIDLAYSAPAGSALSQEQQDIADALGNPGNQDGLGAIDPNDVSGSALYVNYVARVASPDYRQWPPGGWALNWEGTIGSAQSQTGRIECAPGREGWEGGTCRAGEPGDVRLVDENASFCNEGVLAGDKLVVLGCLTDDDCGLGQRCLRDPVSGASASGICISSQAFEEQAEKLRRICGPFISDPCGTPRREYLITRAFQEELWLQSMDIAQRSYLVESSEEDVPFEEAIDRLTCQLPLAPSHAQPHEGQQACQDDEDCVTHALNDGEGWVCVAGFCRGPCTGGYPDCLSCVEDGDCAAIGPDYLCIDSRCRTPCEGGSNECLLSALPGPRCFSELVRYVVRGRNSFIVEGQPPAPAFMTDRVAADATSGECGIDPEVSNLLTSRIWLGEDAEDTFNHPTWGIPDCPDNSFALPGDPNPCRVVAPRNESGGPLFHHFSYEDQRVEAIRFTNPYMSIVLDLVDLRSLAGTFPGMPDVTWPSTFASFHRARIPRNYREEFSTQPGYSAINARASVQNVPLTYPVRIINGPDLGVAFVVDGGGQPGVAGTRGQVVRILANEANVRDDLADQSFRVR